MLRVRKDGVLLCVLKSMSSWWETDRLGSSRAITEMQKPLFTCCFTYKIWLKCHLYGNKGKLISLWADISRVQTWTPENLCRIGSGLSPEFTFYTWRMQQKIVRSHVFTTFGHYLEFLLRGCSLWHLNSLIHPLLWTPGDYLEFSVCQKAVINTDTLQCSSRDIQKSLHYLVVGSLSVLGIAPLPESVINSPFIKILLLWCCRTYELHSDPPFITIFTWRNYTLFLAPRHLFGGIKLCMSSYALIISFPDKEGRIGRVKNIIK